MTIETPTGTPDPEQPSAGTETGQAPQPIQLTEESLVQLPGSEKPTKYGEWFRGFQSKHTKATTELAELQRKFQQIESERQRERQELDRFRQAANPQPQSRAKSLLDQIRERSYLTGEDASTALENVLNEVGGGFQRRDAALTLIANKLAQLDEVVNQLNNQHATQQFSSKIKAVLDKMGLPEEAMDLAQEIYLAYEGDNLDQEFPTIFENRWKQLQNLVNNINKAKVNEAKQRKFVPGQGPVGSAGKPIDISRMGAKDTADLLWETMVNGGEDT